jgi:membrane protein implicated in regulation of membrane protease activity
LENLDQDPEIRAARRRLHMWLGSLTTLAALVTIGFAFFLFSRFGISPWQTVKLGMPLMLGIAAFLGFAFLLSLFTSRHAERLRSKEQAPPDQEQP